MDSLNDTFQKRLLETFSIEAKEHIDTLSNGLLELKKTPDAQSAKVLVEVLFREAHSFKGASRAVSIIEIEEVCKAMEDVFNHYKKSGAGIPDTIIEVMLESNDFLSLLLKSDETQRKALKPQAQKMIKSLYTLFESVESNSAEELPIPEEKINVLEPVATEELSHPQKDKDKKLEDSAPVDKVTKTPVMQNNETKKQNFIALQKEFTTVSETIRVPVTKLNAIMRQAEELLFAKMVSKRYVAELLMIIDEMNALTTALHQGEHLSHDTTKQAANIESMLFKALKQTKDESREIDMTVDRLLSEMKEALMLPFSTLFYTLPKIVHDIAKSVGKEIILNVVGGDIEIDRRILEEMSDPLMHLLRNAIDHGIEEPQVRLQKGKERSGTITLSLTQHSGSKVELSIRDDGAGIVPERIVDVAVKRGIIDREEAENLEEGNALNLIFQSGVSTAQMVTDLSGRGLGLAIVREKVEHLGGKIKMESTEEGSEFKMILPLTMATFKGVQTSAGGQTFIFPSEHIARATKVRHKNITHIEGKEMLIIDHHAVPYYRLTDILELPSVSEQSVELSVVVIVLDSHMLAIGVDNIEYEEEVMVKSLGKQLSRIKNIASATLLASDVPALILNISDIFKSVEMVKVQIDKSEKEVLQRNKKILVVDDSMTTRTLLQNIIEMVGYDTVSATDGLDAYEKLKKESFDLVVSDVDMPKMDGFELTQSIRSDTQLSELPLILVTSLESQQDKEKGMRSGASAYIVKSSFDQKNLLDTISWLIDIGDKND